MPQVADVCVTALVPEALREVAGKVANMFVNPPALLGDTQSFSLKGSVTVRGDEEVVFPTGSSLSRLEDGRFSLYAPGGGTFLFRLGELRGEYRRPSR